MTHAVHPSAQSAKHRLAATGALLAMLVLAIAGCSNAAPPHDTLADNLGNRGYGTVTVGSNTNDGYTTLLIRATQIPAPVDGDDMLRRASEIAWKQHHGPIDELRVVAPGGSRNFSAATLT